MKAFSPDIFTEQTTSEIIQESNSIVKPAEKSLIEFKTDCIRAENELRRNFYKRYITESCDNVVMEKILMDCEINAIHESYNEYAKTHKSDSVILESGLTGAVISSDEISIDECMQAYDLEVESCIFEAIQKEAKIFAESDISEKERKKLKKAIAVLEDIVSDDREYTPSFDELRNLKMHYDPYLYNAGLL